MIDLNKELEEIKKLSERDVLNSLTDYKYFIYKCMRANYSSATIKRIINVSQKTRYSSNQIVNFLDSTAPYFYFPKEIIDEILLPIKYMKQVVSILQQYKAGD